MRHINHLAATTLIMLLSACGGGGGETTSDAMTGAFVDSPVSGLHYVTDSLEGTTDAQGRYHYRAGEIVEFSLGGVTLGQAGAAATVTPSDLTGHGLADMDSRSRNMLRLLQTLDEDCNPSNGITINAAIQQRADALNMALPETQLEFEQSAELLTLLSESGCADTWVTELQAELHYRVAMQSEAAAALAKVALIVLDGATTPVAAVDEYGNSITLLPVDIGAGASARIVMTGVDGQQIGISLDALGMPTNIYLGNGVVIYLTNFSEESVDIAISEPGSDVVTAYRLELTEEEKAYFRHFTSIGMLEGEMVGRVSPAMPRGLGGSLLDALISPAYAEDLTQVLGAEIKRATGVANYITGVIDEAVALDAVIQGRTSTLAYVGDYAKGAAGKLADSVTDKVKDILWNAAMHELGLNQDEQRVLDVSVAALQCGAAANVAGCKDAFMQSVEATYELGGLLYVQYQDSDRLAQIEAELALVDFESKPPVVAIDSTMDGNSYTFGTPVTLSGSAFDVDEGPITDERLFWSSDRDGELGEGATLTVNNLTPGVHIIALTAESLDGERRTRRISIEIGNTAPVVTISSPISGLPYAAGESILFAGSAMDAEEGPIPGTQLEWRSSVDNRILGTGSAISVNDLLAPAASEVSSSYAHTITLTATDSFGKSGAASIVVNIFNTVLVPPTVEITTTNTSYDFGVAGYITATALSGTGVGLTASSIEWRSSRDGVVGYGDSLNVSLLSEGTHLITVTAVDNGLSASDTITITVAAATGEPGVSVMLDSEPVWSHNLATIEPGYTFIGFNGAPAALTATATASNMVGDYYYWWSHYEIVQGLGYTLTETPGATLTTSLPWGFGLPLQMKVLTTPAYTTDYWSTLAVSEIVVPFDMSVPDKGVNCSVDGVSEICYWDSSPTSPYKYMRNYNIYGTYIVEEWLSRGEPDFPQEAMFERVNYLNGNTWYVNDKRTTYDANGYRLASDEQGATVKIECTETGELVRISGANVTGTVRDGDVLDCIF
jgi:hypothetical protein